MSDSNSTLTADRLREVLQYDPESGFFTWTLNVSSTGRKGGVAGCTNAAGYVLIRIDKKLHLAHRLAFLYVTGQFPLALVDHRDMVKSNNRWTNLRLASKGQNAQNKIAAQSNNRRTGLLGVYWSGQRKEWGAKLVVNRKQLFGGFHATPEMAHQAYIRLKRTHHPFGNL